MRKIRSNTVLYVIWLSVSQDMRELGIQLRDDWVILLPAMACGYIHFYTDDILDWTADIRRWRGESIKSIHKEAYYAKREETGYYRNR